MKKSKDALFPLLVLCCLTILGITAPGTDFKPHQGSLLSKSFTELNKSSTKVLNHGFHFDQNMSSSEELNPGESSVANYSAVVRDSTTEEPAQ